MLSMTATVTFGTDMSRHHSLEQNRRKQRRYRDNKYWAADVRSRITPEIEAKLLDAPHPFFNDEWQSLYCYVDWLLNHGQSYKARQIIDAL